MTREAGHALRQAFAAARTPDADPIEAMTRMILAAWTAGDQYRTLVALGQRELNREAILAGLAPAREEAVAVLRRDQDEGVFAGHLPAPVLAQALEALRPALAENAACMWADPMGESAAIASLVAAGVAPQRAVLQVQALVRRDRAAGGG
ncbi:hypothetical protein ACF1AB_22455 [Streptomyces sp. NPDC014846]|uniref:hypothetical protein n=1 Tax=Streptomyces sp. NPDC014846 TaxID=3364922 RepID=UPI003701EC38